MNSLLFISQILILRLLRVGETMHVWVLILFGATTCLCVMSRNIESGILNPESWVLDSGIQLKDSRIPLTIGIQNPSSTDKYWNPVPGIRNPHRRIQNPRLSWISLHGAI